MSIDVLDKSRLSFLPVGHDALIEQKACLIVTQSED